MYWATGVPGWARWGWGAGVGSPYAPPWGPWAGPLTKEQEAELLKDEAEYLRQQQEYLKQQMEEIEKRLQELSSEEK